MQLNFLPPELLAEMAGTPKRPLTAPRKAVQPPLAVRRYASAQATPTTSDVQETQEPEIKSNDKAPSAFKTISEAAAILEVPQHVLRFWESRFGQIKPLKMRGGRRYYRPQDMETLSTIKRMLYQEGYTIKGARKHFAEHKREARELAAETAAIEAETPRLNDERKQQLHALRDELLAMRDTLTPYLA